MKRHTLYIDKESQDFLDACVGRRDDRVSFGAMLRHMIHTHPDFEEMAEWRETDRGSGEYQVWLALGRAARKGEK